MTVMQLSQAAQEKLEELRSQHYHDEDMYNFIEEYSEYEFVEYYEAYVDMAEEYDYEAVDAFVDNFGIENIASFPDSYNGRWDSFQSFVEAVFPDIYGPIPEQLLNYIDWAKVTDEWEYDYEWTPRSGETLVFLRNF